jgi:hypothetical protein
MDRAPGMGLDYRYRIMWNMIRILLLSLLLTCLTRSAWAASWAPVALTDSLGAEIDSLERRAYGLFPDLDDYRAARFQTNGSGYRVEITHGTGPETRTTKLSAEAWESTRLHARMVEQSRGLEGSPSTSNDELQYRLALRFAAASHHDVSRTLLDDLASRSAGTPLGDEAAATRADLDRILGTSRGLWRPQSLHDQNGRTDLLIFAGFHGLWTGIAVPVALEAEDEKVYAAGLLAAPTLSILLASSASRHTEMGVGRAHVISLGGWLGTWQGVGWAAVSDADGQDVVGIGLVSGYAGIAAASLLTSQVHFSEGHGTLTSNSLWWGAWFGLIGGILADAEDDDLLRASLIGSDAFVLGTAIGARNARMSKGRVRLISLMGIVGTAAGFGADLLFEAPDEKVAFGIAGFGTFAGLVTGVNMTRNHDVGKDLSAAPRPEEDRWSLAPHAGVIRDPESGRPVPAMGLRVTF